MEKGLLFLHNFGTPKQGYFDDYETGSGSSNFY
jgi:hypothetical protein